MSILAVLMGLTTGALTRAGKAGILESGARVVRSGLHRARSLALAGSTLSKVTITPSRPDGTPAVITTHVSRTAGSWHFDGESDVGIGGDGVTMRLLGASPVPGFVRDGIAVTAVSRAIGPPIDNAPTQDPRLGFALEMRILPSGPGTIARFGGTEGDSGTFALRLNEDGSLAAEATVRGAENSGLNVQTRPKVIEMGQWAKVGISHDGVELAVTAHNVVEARVADLHDLETEPSSALVLGGFSGIIDEVIYRTVGETDDFKLDRQVAVDLNYPTTVRFNRDGRLNERFHNQPVVIPLSHEGRTVSITVDLAGVTR
jgi:hypothetical protein